MKKQVWDKARPKGLGKPKELSPSKKAAAKRKRIAEGSGEKMRKPGAKGAPTAAAFKEAAKTAKPRKK